jgi:methylated-DNA-[protein]-cysteine S-methyltransferase
MKKKTKQMTIDLEQIQLESPVGTLVLSAKDGMVTEIYQTMEQEMNLPLSSATEPVLNHAAAELREYFAGMRTSFSFPMQADGTPFQESVWDALLKIPYGDTRTYGQIALAIGNPKASRAVGMACNRNPIMIAVPCHRVIGADGSLTGYAPGTELKQIVLDLERKA